jgi:N-formylglutamate amidohydrolase
MEATHARFGTAVLIDCHSMPASVRVGETGLRPDFIIGDRFGTSCADALSELAIGALASMGYAVAHNKPYAGGYITEHYGRPAAGFHALQIEINRGLYLREAGLSKTGGFATLEADLARFAAAMISIPPEDLQGLPLAAE